MKRRTFIEGEYMHIYQRTIHRHNIFYSPLDYIVYFTIFCMLATKMKISVLELCLMIDHLHMMILGATKDTVSKFISAVSSTFIREYNKAANRTGQLFEKRFGRAPKQGRKKLVSAIIYIGNNPVEKKICRRAEQYRWNFLAYLDSQHPFSERFISTKASYRLKNAIKIVDWQHSHRNYLKYSLLQRIFNGLDSKETAQLTDYIISKYNVLDTDRLIKIFGSYDQMLEAMNSTVGSEYEIKEHFDQYPDTVYQDMIRYVKEHITPDVRQVTTYDLKEKMKLANKMKTDLRLSLWQIEKFIHM